MVNAGKWFDVCVFEWLRDIFQLAAYGPHSESAHIFAWAKIFDD